MIRRIRRHRRRQLIEVLLYRAPPARPAPPAKAAPRRPALAHTPQEAAEAAAVVGFTPGLDSQIQRSE
jgi:hypothetical protein